MQAKVDEVNPRMQDLAEREVEAWPSPTVPQPLCPPTVPQPGPPTVCQPGGQVPLFMLLANFSTPLGYSHLNIFMLAVLNNSHHNLLFSKKLSLRIKGPWGSI